MYMEANMFNTCACTFYNAIIITQFTIEIESLQELHVNA